MSTATAGLTHGMDTAAGLAASQQIDAGAQQVKDLAARLDGALAHFDWHGTDADRTREEWAASGRPSLDATSQHLAALAVLIRGEAQAQDAASGEGGAPGPSVTTGTSPSPQQQSFLGRVGDWVGRRLDATFAGLGRMAFFADSYAGKVAGLLAGEDVSTMSLLADVVGFGAAGVGTVKNAIDGVDHRWMADGTGVAGAAVVVPTDAADGTAYRPALTRPTDLASIMQSTTDAYTVGASTDASTDISAVRILKVDQHDGPASYIVSMPGTETWSMTAGTNARDTAGNVLLAGGHPAAAMESVRRAIEQNVPPGSDIMLVPHSQAGMSAGMLAGDPAFTSRYHVTHVMAYGAPIDQMRIPASTDVLQIAHGNDIVPRLDLGGVRETGLPGVRTLPDWQPGVTLDSPAGITGIEANHDYRTYAADVRRELGADSAAGQRLRDYQATLGAYLAGPGTTVTAVDVPVSRQP